MRMEKTDFEEYAAQIAHKILYYSYKGETMYVINPDTEYFCYNREAQDMFHVIFDDVKSFLADRVEVKDND